MKLVYINNSKSSVFDSQVLALLKYYQENAFFEKVILIFGYQNQQEIEWLRNKDTAGIIIYFYRSYPNYPFLNYLIQRNLFRILRSVSTNFSDYFFHIRSEMLSYHFKRIMSKLGVKTSQLLTDVRGTSIQELKEFSNANGIIKYLKLINYKLALNSLKKDSNISVVSNFFKSYIESLEFNNSNIYVNPCLVNDNFTFDISDRLRKRKKLLLKDNEILIIFTSGGTANWQNNDMILKLADKGLKVLNLSKRDLDYDNVITKFVPYDEVPSYLSAADVAFIWRDASIVNRVASPVKVSEYMACGLPIIHNGVVELINEVTENMEDALCINDIGDLKETDVAKLVETVDRKLLSEKGKKIFGLQTLSKSYQKIYFNEQ